MIYYLKSQQHPSGDYFIYKYDDTENILYRYEDGVIVHLGSLGGFNANRARQYNWNWDIMLEEDAMVELL